jgi:hypothetical protein
MGRETNFPSCMSANGITFSAPYNFQDGYFDEVIIPHRGDVESIFLAIPYPYGSTMRPWGDRPGEAREPINVDIFHRKVDEFYLDVTRLGIRLEFVANGLQGGQQSAVIEEFLLQLDERYPGSMLSVRSLMMARRLKQRRPEVEILPSTMADIRSPLTATYWKDLVNPRVITIAREINRRPSALRALKRMGFRLRAVHEDGCLACCPVAGEHAQAIRRLDVIANDDAVITKPVAESCLPEALHFKRNPATRWMQALTVILPGHLDKLNGLLDILKIEGRRQTNDEIRRRMDRYVEGSSLVSQQTGFREPPEAWEKLANCNQDCPSCGWCERHIEFLSDEGPSLVNVDA